jgi:hypothetical protein
MDGLKITKELMKIVEKVKDDPEAGKSFFLQHHHQWKGLKYLLFDRTAKDCFWSPKSSQYVLYKLNRKRRHIFVY